ncbi:MAG: hypothetical protein IEMM0008_1273 [bacterium]|nr:MAG: hypothetical protein IEMM0008_1273 [bacterium]
MSGLYNQPYRRKASLTKIAVVSISIIALLALGFRVYYINYLRDNQPKQQEKTDDLYITEHHSDQNTDNILTTDEESTSEDTSELIQTNDPEEEKTNKTLTSFLSKPLNVQLDLNLSPTNEKRNQTITAKSAIRGDQMGPKNIISPNSQTYQGFKDQDREILSTTNIQYKKKRSTTTKTQALNNSKKAKTHKKDLILQPLTSEKSPRKKSKRSMDQPRKSKAPKLKKKDDASDFLFSHREKMAFKNAKLREDIALSEPEKKKDDF